MKKIKIQNSSRSKHVITVKYCDTFFNKFAGLMFSKELAEDQGIIIVEQNESRINTSIHMMFMNFDLTILWLDKNKVIVDKVLAKKWAPFHFPKQPAQYVIEMHQSKFSEYSIGDRLVFLNEEEV